jgi:hypothetical protein
VKFKKMDSFSKSFDRRESTPQTIPESGSPLPVDQEPELTKIDCWSFTGSLKLSCHTLSCLSFSIRPADKPASVAPGHDHNSVTFPCKLRRENPPHHFPIGVVMPLVWVMRTLNFPRFHVFTPTCLHYVAQAPKNMRGGCDISDFVLFKDSVHAE